MPKEVPRHLCMRLFAATGLQDVCLCGGDEIHVGGGCFADVFSFPQVSGKDFVLDMSC